MTGAADADARLSMFGFVFAHDILCSTIGTLRSLGETAVTGDGPPRAPAGKIRSTCGPTKGPDRPPIFRRERFRRRGWSGGHYSEAAGYFPIDPNLKGKSHIDTAADGFVPFAIGDVEPDGAFIGRIRCRRHVGVPIKRTG